MQADIDSDLLAHLVRVSGLPQHQLKHLIVEVLAYYDEPVEVFVRRRHQALQTQAGWHNEQIFEQIGLELTQRRFKSAPLSARQLRRLVYG